MNPHCNAWLVAGEVLLELKLSFNAMAGQRWLGSWRPADPNPCGWKGVSCSSHSCAVSALCRRSAALGAARLGQNSAVDDAMQLFKVPSPSFLVLA